MRRQQARYRGRDRSGRSRAERRHGPRVPRAEGRARPRRRPANWPPAQGARRDRYRRSTGRSGARRGCRYRPRRCIRAPAGAGRRCHTSCRNGRDGAPSGSWWRASPPAVPPPGPCRSSRNPRLRSPTAGRGRYWWATSGGRRSASDPPGSCPVEDRDPQASRKSRRSARSGERSTAEPWRRQPMSWPSW